MYDLSKRPIAINPENEKKIMEIFDEAQGRARVRKISSFRQLEGIIKDIEKRMSCITKKALEGTRLDYDFGQRFSSHYKHSPDSTNFGMVYKHGRWVLTYVRRYYCPRRNSKYLYTLHLSDSAKEAVLNNFT